MEGWGTWEELLLGGAVMRHGTRDWDRVASELRTRTDSSSCAFAFTPQVCRAKYEDLRQRFSGSTAWFEELRNRRMVELRQALEQSESSIGSLETKLESLKAERGDYSNVDCDSSRTESLLPLQNSDGAESCPREIFKDALSSGSFTQDASMNSSANGCAQVLALTEEMGTKPDLSEYPEQEKCHGTDGLVEFCGDQGGCLKKRRGKRKRKNCGMPIKEGSVGESEFTSSADVLGGLQRKDALTFENGSAWSGGLSGSRDLRKESVDDLMWIFNSIAEHKSANVFHHRLNCQKRARYKKLVRQHVDFQTIKSRITSGGLTSSMEVFRDILLLINNALVFYSKNTRERKSALLLRDIVCQKLRRHYRGTGTEAGVHCVAPVKPPSVIRHEVQKTPTKVSDAKNTRRAASPGSKGVGNSDSPPSALSSASGKKGSTWSYRGKNGNAGRRPSRPTRGRKRARTR